ncbi:MAG TPA: hypothetical protein VLK29_01390 [Luteimonas sp.]|nr:hypothetical protein [Luteimonas sp.]
MLQTRRAWLIGVSAVLLTILSYLPGLSGPYLLDDSASVEAVAQWHAGERSLAATVLPNDRSILFSRPVAMASLAANAALAGPSPFAFKLGNLLVHLACGALVLLLLQRCLALDQNAKHARLLGLFLACAWILHPLHVSTVLYVVQRMAQLSALFTLLAVLSYLVARCRLRDGHPAAARVLLFAAFPLAWVAGLLSKQNAAVAPLLCLVLEYAYFPVHPRPRQVTAFFALFALPVVLGGLALLSVAPATLLSGYSDWDFTLGERLLSQPRALLDYIALTLLPNGPRMGLYTDDFTVSTGLFEPWTTLPAIALLAAASIAALLVRRRAPSITAGWGFFLVAHLVESTFLPLEMYYEHRNYLPSVGLLLAAAGCGQLLVRKLQDRRGRGPTRMATPVPVLVVLVLAFATFARAGVWQSEASILQQALLHHPTSMRAMLDQASLYIRQGRYDDALAATEPLRHDPRRRPRLNGYLHQAAVECMRGTVVNPVAMARAVDNALPRLTVYEVNTATLLVMGTPTGRCGPYSTRHIADGLDAIADQAAADTPREVIYPSIRTMAAQLYLRSGDWTTAREQADDAWLGHRYLPAGALLVRILIELGDSAAAHATLDQLSTRIRPFDTAGQAQLAAVRARVQRRFGPDAAAAARPEAPVQ